MNGLQVAVYVREVPQPLPRFLDRQRMLDEQRRVLDRILLEVGDEAPASAAGATAVGDPRRLRGLPAVGRGTGGTVFGTDPLRALIAKESRRQPRSAP